MSLGSYLSYTAAVHAVLYIKLEQGTLALSVLYLGANYSSPVSLNNSPTVLKEEAEENYGEGEGKERKGGVRTTLRG